MKKNNSLKIQVEQINFIVGDIPGNCQKISAAYKRAQKHDIDLVIFSELAITGYPPEDLLLKSYFIKETEKAVKEILGDKAKTNYRSVEDYTKSPEVLGGRVKTLHPRVHGGILAQRNNPAHARDLYELAIELDQAVRFDMVVCNLYAFEKKVAKKGVTIEDAIESIDIGGPTMIRGAAKNWQNVAVVTIPDTRLDEKGRQEPHPDRQYSLLVEHMRKCGGITAEQRFELAAQAFALMATYDAAITRYLATLEYNHDIKQTLKFTGENNE